MASVVTYGNGPARSAHAIPAEHQKFGTQNIFNARQIEASARWSIFNSSNLNLMVDLRYRLNKRRDLGPIFLPDETWVEYTLNGGGFQIDRFRAETGIATIVSPPFAIPLPPGQSTPQFSLFVPGPAANNAALNFWSNQDDAAFNLLLEVYQVPFNGATAGEGIKIGSHEYKDVFKVDVDPPPLSALDIGEGGTQPRLIVRTL